jgi:hypothetical protein
MIFFMVVTPVPELLVSEAEGDLSFDDQKMRQSTPRRCSAGNRRKNICLRVSGTL